MENKQYLLDTNILIGFVHGNRSVINRILHTGFDRCCMSVVSLQGFKIGRKPTQPGVYIHHGKRSRLSE